MGKGTSQRERMRGCVARLLCADAGVAAGRERLSLIIDYRSAGNRR